MLALGLSSSCGWRRGWGHQHSKQPGLELEALASHELRSVSPRKGPEINSVSLLLQMRAVGGSWPFLLQSNLWTTENHQFQFAQFVPHKSHVPIFLAQLVPVVFLSHPWPAKRPNTRWSLGILSNYISFWHHGREMLPSLL